MQAVQNNGSVWVHALFDADVAVQQPYRLPQSAGGEDDEDLAEEIAALDTRSRRNLRFGKSWRETSTTGFFGVRIVIRIEKGSRMEEEGAVISPLSYVLLASLRQRHQMRNRRIW